MTTEDCYSRIVEAFRRNPRVTVGSQKKGFGASALKVNGKIFAMRSSKGEFVVKLPSERVDELVASKKGGRFDPGRGRVMTEWFAASEGTDETWLTLAKEALKFVSSKQ